MTNNNRIYEVFNFYKQALIHQDMFDSVEDKDIINRYALSETSIELDISKKELSKILGLDKE